MYSYSSPMGVVFFGVQSGRGAATPKKPYLAEPAPSSSLVSASFVLPEVAPFTASGAALLASYNQVALQRSGQTNPRQPEGSRAADLLKKLKLPKPKVPKK